MKKLVFAAVLASILLVALVTWHSAEPQRPQPDTALALEASVELIAPAKAPGQPAALSLSRTTAVGDLEPAPPAALALAVPTEGATVGTLLVRVTERESGAPAPGVALEIVPWSPSHTWFHRRSAVTDEGGEVRFERVPPGRITVYLRRLTAADTFGAERVEVVAGETCEVSCQVIAGLTLHGTVRDAAGRAVAGADVWLATGAGAPEEGDPVTRTDADGRYRLRHASRFQGVAARAAGYAPSDVAVPLFAADGTAGEALGECQMDLVLPDLGGALEGLVVDSSGAPEADALIVIRAATRPERSEGGHRIYGPPDLLLRTDAAGRFRTDRMGAGTLHVCARGMDTGLAQAHVEVPVGGVGTVRLELGSSSTVFGRITTDRALPVFDAILELSGQDRRLVWSRARAAEDGSFELSGVPPGRITLSVQSKALDTGTNETFDLSPGERREWLPVLPTTGEIVGRVVDEHGAGLPRWSVRRDAEGDESGGPLAYGLAHTDAAGEFRLQGCLDGPHTLQVLPPGQLFAEPVATARGITPSSPILTLVVPKELIPSCTLRGRCLDAAGAPVAALISLQAVEPIVVLTECATDAAGVFRFEHLAATEYRVRIQVDGRSVDAPGSPVRLTPDTPAVDLGPLVLP